MNIFLKKIIVDTKSVKNIFAGGGLSNLILQFNESEI